MKEKYMKQVKAAKQLKKAVRYAKKDTLDSKIDRQKKAFVIIKKQHISGHRYRELYENLLKYKVKDEELLKDVIMYREKLIDKRIVLHAEIKSSIGVVATVESMAVPISHAGRLYKAIREVFGDETVIVDSGAKARLNDALTVNGVKNTKVKFLMMSSDNKTVKITNPLVNIRATLY